MRVVRSEETSVSSTDVRTEKTEEMRGEGGGVGRGGRRC